MPKGLRDIERNVKVRLYARSDEHADRELEVALNRLVEEGYIESWEPEEANARRH